MVFLNIVFNNVGKFSMIILVEQQIEFSELTTLNFGLEKLTTILWFTRILPWCRRLLSCRAHIHWTALNRLGASPSFKSQSTTSLPTKQHWYIRKWYLRSLIMSGFLSQCSRALRCSDNSKIWTNLEEIRSIFLLLYSYHISLPYVDIWDWCEIPLTNRGLLMNIVPCARARWLVLVCVETET